MGVIKKSITVTDQQEALIQALLTTGQYASDSEVIREALREKELRIREINELRAKPIASENSGLSNRTPEQIRSEAKSRLKSR